MKNIDYYLKLPYRLEIVPNIYEGGYVASYPEFPGCLTCAETLEEVISSALDAKKAWLEAALEDGDTIQEPEFNEETIAALNEAEEICKYPFHVLFKFFMSNIFSITHCFLFFRFNKCINVFLLYFLHNKHLR